MENIIINEEYAAIKIVKPEDFADHTILIENSVRCIFGNYVSNIRKLLIVFILRGPTPFEDMIFYLWTDSNKICTAYVKLKINHILFMKNFWFSI